MKHCPFCHKIVWFWQSKAYLDAQSKRPCHAYCLLWDIIGWGDNRDEMNLLLRTPIVGLSGINIAKQRGPKSSLNKKEVEKVDDDTWQRGLEK